jgi:hypothetical protein
MSYDFDPLRDEDIFYLFGALGRGPRFSGEVDGAKSNKGFS